MKDRFSLLGIKPLSPEQLIHLINNSAALSEISRREIKKTPALRGKTVLNVFFENSTRTRTSFEIAGKWLSADVINVNLASSSVAKGESLYDTVQTLGAMNPDVIVVRHPDAGIPDYLERNLQSVSIINAGDGTREHPTQALLDALTLKQHFALDSAAELTGKSVAFVGDIVNSRVAKSNIWTHLKLGNEVRLVGPETLLPADFANNFCLKGNGETRPQIYRKLSEGLAEVDVIYSLRLQKERQNNFLITDQDDYSSQLIINQKALSYADKDVVVMHPGPVNRGVELAEAVADSERSLILKQVNNGLAVRMAVLLASCQRDRSTKNADGVDSQEERR